MATDDFRFTWRGVADALLTAAVMEAIPPAVRFGSTPSCRLFVGTVLFAVFDAARDNDARDTLADWTAGLGDDAMARVEAFTAFHLRCLAAAGITLLPPPQAAGGGRADGRTQTVALSTYSYALHARDRAEQAAREAAGRLAEAMVENAVLRADIERLNTIVGSCERYGGR